MGILSMTGFGRGAVHHDAGSFSVEIKGVNHRHLDIRVRLPKALSAAEPAVKAVVSKVLSRGRIEVSFTEIEGQSSSGASLNLDMALAKAVAEAHRELAKEADVPLSLDSRVLLQTPGVLQVDSKVLASEEQLALALPAVEQALTSLCDMRSKEGAKIEAHLLSLLGHMQSLLTILAKRAPEQAERYRSRLQKRLSAMLKELDAEVDQWKLLHEVGVFAEKTDVMEEISRLESHFEQAETLLKKPNEEAVGRRLDFLCQEINREVNTVGSKVQDSDMLAVCLDLKAELERFREQVQNVE